MRKPKLRELKEAVKAVIFGPYTSKYPFKPHTPPDGFRGKPEFDEEECIGCGACAEVCPALAIKVIDDPEAAKPVRRLVQRCDKCIFCGQCELNCTTKKGITLTKTYDMSTLDRAEPRTEIEHELVICEVCGAVVGTRKHLRWVAQRLGAKAYANPTLIVCADGSMKLAAKDAGRPGEPALARSDMMRIACPACRRTLVVRELWGE
ncbi:MAG: 4Fe-4S dicluster domain-containing protein [Planctomycetota bacterium]|nr:4Fe-4S dicluster domain-containing protein [Planctomycetota bacterium]